MSLDHFSTKKIVINRHHQEPICILFEYTSKDEALGHSEVMKIVAVLT